MAKRIVPEVATRTVYTSPCGRARVECHGRREYLALLDDQACGWHDFAFQAEYAANTALTEALELEAVQIADESAGSGEDYPIETEAVVCEGTGDVIGTTYRVGEVEIFVSADPVLDADDEPMVFLPGKLDGFRISVFEQAIPVILAILADPNFQSARSRLLKAR